MLGGIFRSVLNPINLMQLAAGPAGWASLAMRAVVTNIAQTVIQRIGQQLGVPQPFIDIAQQTIGNRMGNPAAQLGSDGSLRSIANALGTKSGPTKLVAVADVFEDRLTQSFKSVKEKFDKQC